jgi:hypothetical protein
MKIRVFGLALVLAACGASAVAQYQPPGVSDALANLTSQRATQTSFTVDRDMLQNILGQQPAAAINSVGVQNYHFSQPAFYVPEEMQALVAAFGSAGWTHLVQANVSPRESASPTKMISDIWMHFKGMEIDQVTVLLRGQKQMDVIQISGLLNPIEFAHLSGHFGIPKVDPSAVMVPAPPGK